ncbi:hypothetical protein T190611E02C_11002 [Tenacibaculum sp. 190524A05c]
MRIDILMSLKEIALEKQKKFANLNKHGEKFRIVLTYVNFVFFNKNV